MYKTKAIKIIGTALTFATIATSTACGMAHAADASSTAALAQGESRVNVIFDRELPNVPGKSLRGVLVKYGPGGSTPCHTHPPSAFINATILEGEVVSQVNDEPEKTYRVGESFSENPGDRHGVSRNASKTKSAKLLAVFVVNTNEREIATPCKENENKVGK